MNVSIDTTSLRQLANDLTSVGRGLDKRTLGPALTNAAKPALNAVRSNAPVGGNGYERVSLSRGRGRSNDYRRGGATKRDVRLKTVEGVNSEIVRVLVGVSKKSGKVGWRTRFLTLGTRKLRANPFIDRGVSQAISEVEGRFMASVVTTVNKILARARR